LHFEKLPKGVVKAKSFGSWDWPIPHAVPELGLFELLTDVQRAADFSVVDKFFESAANLRPELVQALLRNCKQVKAKRLFLWFSDRHQHDWRRLLETKGVDLGSGKRMIIKGGAYDDRYQITVPKEMTGGSERPLF
ncbi:MAG: type IV toxin-antitoxin system AbiEi family antitoxin domain-containing protein, partial [Deltaproteobacteria bacterium]|nr:type IV toxin-antitoxin system AbiEi family antitoxin domain-containing protein [Deltaproteobacteria bacterium]